MAQSTLIAITAYGQSDDLDRLLTSLREFCPQTPVIVCWDGPAPDGWRPPCPTLFLASMRRGTASIRNHALRHWIECTLHDVCILMDDDCLITKSSFRWTWTVNAYVNGHVEYAFQKDCTAGCCTATTREAFSKVGYQRPEFYAPSPEVGWGYDDSDWARRFRKALGQEKTPGLNFGVKHDTRSRYVTTPGLDRNRAIYEAMADAPVYVPWPG